MIEFPAITLHQPWASLLATGVKEHETRGFKLPDRLIGQWVAIHAAKRQPALPLGGLDPICRRTLGADYFRRLPRGAIIALVQFASCRGTMLTCPTGYEDERSGDWRPGRYAWRVGDRRTFPPIPCGGHQLWWRVRLEFPPGDLEWDPRVPSAEESRQLGGWQRPETCRRCRAHPREPSMTYRRVIPRDLFNEASLLKCYGRLWILLDQTQGHKARLHHDGGAFEPYQDASDGSITLWPSVEFWVGDHRVRLWRPLNSREPWPLYAEHPESGEEVGVFDDDGQLTGAFLILLGSPGPIAQRMGLRV